jgi:MYXO-CTERM domain-containing protein
MFGNQTNYVGTAAGTGDFSSAVTFADFAARSLHLTSAQPSTDRGDPGDAVGDEPAPNGGRINLGAFGGTADAERTATSTAVGGGTHGGTPGADPSGVGVTPTPTPTPTPDPHRDDGGCRVAGGSHGSDGWAMILVGACALVLRRRRASGRACARSRSLK